MRKVRLLLSVAFAAALLASQPRLALGMGKGIGGAGRDDAALIYRDSSTRVTVWAFDSSPGVLIPRILWHATSSWSSAAIKPMLADVTGDGRADVVMAYNYGGTTTGLWVVPGAPGGSSPSLWWRSTHWKWSASKPTSTEAFSGSGPHNPVVLYDNGSSTSSLWVFNVHSGSLFTPYLAWKSNAGGFPWSRSKIVGGDFNGDGYGDVAVLYDFGGGTTGIYVFRSNGSKFTAKLAWKSAPGTWNWSRCTPLAGDVNGDGRDEIVVKYVYSASSGSTAQTGLWTFADVGSSSPSLSKALWSKDTLPPTVFPVTLSDVTNDGRADAVFLGTGSSDYGTSFNWIPSTGSSFDTGSMNNAWDSGSLSYPSCQLIP